MELQDPSAMSGEALQAEFLALAHELARISDRRAALLAQIEWRDKQAAARSRLAGMSEADKEALRTALKESP